MDRFLRKLLVGAICLVTLGAGAAGFPAKIRIISCDLGSLQTASSSAMSAETFPELQKLLEKADADVICLQGGIDWELADKIAKLKSGFRVLTCSAYPAKIGSAAPPQVAILARERAILSWVEPLPDGGAFAVAVFQTGGRKLGLFSVAGNSRSAASSDRISSEVRKLRDFPQNRPEAFFVAGTGLVESGSLAELGFQTAPEHAQLLGLNAGFLSKPREVTVGGIRTPLLVCDLDTGNATPSKFAYQSVLLFAGETAADVEALTQRAARVAKRHPTAAFVQPTVEVWPYCIAGGVLLLGALFLSRKARRHSGLQLVAVNPGGTDLVKKAGGDEQLRSSLLAWFKMQFMQRLLSQRAELIDTQEEATERTRVIEEKLSVLQTALQERISAYEFRIQRLEDELTAATFENRDLIRSQIELLKEKVAKAREESSFRRN